MITDASANPLVYGILDGPLLARVDIVTGIRVHIVQGQFHRSGLHSVGRLVNVL